MAQIVTPNRIKIRNGKGQPPSGEQGLLQNELGFDRDNKVLYIGLESETIPITTIYQDVNGDGNITIKK